MKKAIWIVVALSIIMGISICVAVAGDWNSSPNNWENSPNNWNNSPNNWNNSPNNWNNSPNKWGNDRIIYDNDGQPKGYVVPKENGGANVYDLNGNRRGYKPSDNNE